MVLFLSYLTDQSQKVVINGIESDDKIDIM